MSIYKLMLKDILRSFAFTTVLMLPDLILGKEIKLTKIFVSHFFVVPRKVLLRP